MNCPGCGQALEAGARRCKACGTRVVPGQLESLEGRIQDRLRSTEERIKRRLEEVEGRIQGGPAVPRASGAAATEVDIAEGLLGRIQLDADSELKVIDRVFLETFEIRRYLPKGTLDYPTHYCETLEEFFAPFVESEECSDTQKQRQLEAYIARARQQAPAGIYGVYFPGKGCYVNGWLYARAAGRGSAREALRDPAVLPSIFQTAAHEKLGHGFLSEFTAAGQEKKSVHLRRTEVADAFKLDTPDTPDGAIWEEKWNLLFETSKFVEEGWATWVEAEVLERLDRGKGSRIDLRRKVTRYEAGKVLAALRDLERQISSPELRNHARAARDGLETLVAGTTDPQRVHDAVRMLQASEGAIRDLFGKLVGQAPRYAVGSVLMSRIAENAGTLLVPYAVAIACHVTYDVEKVPNETLARLVATNPRFNIDSRLALLANVRPSRRDDVAGFARIAREELSLKPPEDLAGGL